MCDSTSAFCWFLACRDWPPAQRFARRGREELDFGGNAIQTTYCGDFSKVLGGSGEHLASSHLSITLDTFCCFCCDVIAVVNGCVDFDMDLLATVIVTIFGISILHVMITLRAWHKGANFDY